jgi:hypothetical protein
MQRNRHFTMRHAILPVRHHHTMNTIHPIAANAPSLPATPRVSNREIGSKSGKDSYASPCKDGIILCRDILLLFGVTLAVGWAVGGVVAKLFVDLVTR